MVNGYLVHKLGQQGSMYFGAINLLIAYALVASGFPFGVMAVLMVLQGSGVGKFRAKRILYH